MLQSKAAFRPVLSIGLCSAPRHGVKATHGLSHGFATLPVIHQDTGPSTIIQHHPMVRTEPSPRLSPCQCPPTRKVLLGAMLMVLRMAVLGSSNADALQAAPRCVCHLNIHKPCVCFFQIDVYIYIHIHTYMCICIYI